MYDLNCYPELNPEVNIFSKAWPILLPGPLRDDCNSHAKQLPHTHTFDARQNVLKFVPNALTF